MLADTRVRRFLLLAAIVVMLVFGSIRIYHYVTTAKITVESGQENTYIKISSADTEQSVETQGQKLSARFRPGEYTVQVFTSVSHINKVIDVESRQNVRLRLSLGIPQKSYPVVDDSGDSISADGSSLYFVDAKNKKLNEIDGQGKISILDNEHSYKKICWVRTGIGVGIDISSNLYAIDGTSINPLALPFPLNNNPSVSCAAAPNGGVYLSNGQDIFLGTMAGGFRRVYSSGNNYNSELAASNYGIAFVEKDPSSDTSSAVVLRRDNGSRKKKAISGLQQLAWSPNGSYIAVAAKGQGRGTIYTNNLVLQKTLPNQDINHLMWYEENSLLYAAGNTLWQYDPQNQTSKSLISLPANQSIADVSVSGSGDYLYFSTNLQLSRVPLNNQPVNASLSSLSAFLPKTVGVCSMDYVNFTQPIITISYPSLSTDPALCVRAAKSQLRYYGLDPNAFQYSVVADTE